jgi:hypothetical protein
MFAAGWAAGDHGRAAPAATEIPVERKQRRVQKKLGVLFFMDDMLTRKAQLWRSKMENLGAEADQDAGATGTHSRKPPPIFS